MKDLDMANMTIYERLDLWRWMAMETDKSLANVTQKFEAANARIAELEDAAQERIAELEAELVSIKHKLIRLEGAQIHEVIDDFGESVTAVTL